MLVIQQSNIRKFVSKQYSKIKTIRDKPNPFFLNDAIYVEKIIIIDALQKHVKFVKRQKISEIEFVIPTKMVLFYDKLHIGKT